MGPKEEVSYYYYNLRSAIKDAKTKIVQRAKAENNKIKFQGKFITNCRKGFNKFLAKHYMKKEEKILSEKEKYPNESYFGIVHGAALANAIDKKMNHLDKLQRLDEMEQLRQNRQAATNVEPAPEIQAQLAQNVQEIQKEAVQEENPTYEPVSEVQAQLAQNVQEIQNEFDETSMQEENVVSEPEVVPAPVSEVVEPEEVTVSEVSNQNQTVVEENTMDDGSELIGKLHQQYNDLGTAFNGNWQEVMRQASAAVNNYAGNVQRVSIEAISNKQVELNQARKENGELRNVNANLNAEISQKNSQIQQLTTDNQQKDQTINTLTLNNQQKDETINTLTASNQEKDVQISNLTAQYNDQVKQNADKDAEIATLRQEKEIMNQQFAQMKQIMEQFHSITAMGMNTAEESGPTLQKS